VQISDQMFNDWVRRHQRLLFGIACRWTGSRTEAEELTQEASLQGYRFRSSLRAASSLQVASHKAVLLRMKNEDRASLLIIDARLTAENTIRSFLDTAGSDSRWSDGRRTYVVLFQGSEQDMHAYMNRMGIVT
jgi:hypothetical protein